MTNPSTLIFLGLAAVWATVLLPEGIRRVAKMRRKDSIRSFNRQLSVLDRSGTSTARRQGSNVIDMRADRQRQRPGSHSQRTLSPRTGSSARSAQSVRPTRAAERRSPAPMAPIPEAVRRRRQEVTAILAAGALLSLLCVIAFSPAFLVVHLVIDVLLVGYLYLVSQANSRMTQPSTSSAFPTTTYVESSAVRRIRPVGFDTGSTPALAASRR